MITRDEDVLAAAESWREAGRDVAIATVVEEAADVIAEGAPRMLEFGVADETAWRVGLSCGGRIKVYVEKLA